MTRKPVPLVSSAPSMQIEIAERTRRTRNKALLVDYLRLGGLVTEPDLQKVTADLLSGALTARMRHGAPTRAPGMQAHLRRLVDSYAAALREGAAIEPTDWTSLERLARSSGAQGPLPCETGKEAREVAKLIVAARYSRTPAQLDEDIYTRDARRKTT